MHTAGNANAAGPPAKQVDPRMHSAEHVLTAALMKLFGTGRPCTTHIERKKSKADYVFNRELTAAEIQSIEAEVNQVLRQDLPIVEEFLPREFADARHDLSRLPAESGDTVRIVHIGEYDACPCIGPHAGRTGEVGTFQIISSSFEGSVLRVRFKLQPAH